MASSGNHQYTIPSKDLDWWSEDATVRFGTNTQKTNEPAWQDVGANVLRMDSLYDASFHDWLKCEDNVTIIASYLQRIANEYPMDRIINALRWLVSSWRVESTATIVRHITAEWAVSPNSKPSTSAPFRLDAPQTSQQADPAVLAGEARRGLLVRELTKDWTCQQIAQLVGMLSLTFWGERNHLEAFLRTLVSDWDFCRLSSFFSYISGQLGLDYRVKVSMLQQAARRNASRLSLKRSRNNMSRSAVAGNSAESEDSGSSKRIRHETAAAASAETGGPSAHAAEPPTLGSETNPRSDSTPQSASTSPAEHTTLVHSPAMAAHAAASVSTSPSFTSPGASEPSALSTRAAQRGRRPAALLTNQMTQYSTSTTPSSPAASAHRRATPMDTDMHEESDSESLELTTAPLSATASSGHLAGSREHEQRRRLRSGTGRSPTMPSTSSPLVSGSYSEQAPTADIVARRPLTPQISSGAYAARSDAQSPTRRRQHRDCPQALTPTHSSASLATLAAPSDQEASTSGLPSRPAMRLHAASVSAGGEPQSRSGNEAVVETTQSSQQQQQQQQQQSHLQQPREQPQTTHAEEQTQEYRARTSSESEMGQFDGPPSTHLALPLPSETAGNTPSLCGRASATATAPYDVLGIVMADSEHHIAGSSA